MKINIHNVSAQNQRLKIIGSNGAVITAPDVTVNPTLGVADNTLAVCLSPAPPPAVECAGSTFEMIFANEPNSIYSQPYHLMYQFNDEAPVVMSGVSSEYGRNQSELLLGKLNELRYQDHSVLRINGHINVQEPSYFNYYSEQNPVERIFGSSTQSDSPLTLKLIPHAVDGSLDIVNFLFAQEITLHSCSVKQWNPNAA